jgi:fibro-slime domain-containing protein
VNQWTALTGAKASADGHVRYFTTATSLNFTYSGPSQYFAAGGADDLWIFVNGRLALDLGGTSSKQGSVQLDAAAAERFALVGGANASLAVFTANRAQNSSSALRLATNIDSLASW